MSPLAPTLPLLQIPRSPLLLVVSPLAPTLSPFFPTLPSYSLCPPLVPPFRVSSVLVNSVDVSALVSWTVPEFSGDFFSKYMYYYNSGLCQ